MTTPAESAGPQDGAEPDGIEPERIEPERIEPDGKDWTWVLQQACPDCGFDAGTVPTPLAGLGSWSAPLSGRDPDRGYGRRSSTGAMSEMYAACSSHA